MALRRVVVTGMGVIAPTGIGPAALWEALLANRSMVGPITAFDASTYPSRIAACCAAFEPRDHFPAARARRLGRFCQMAVAAARLALRDARRDAAPDPRMGIFVGTACGAAQVIEEQFAVFRDKGYRRVHPMLAPMASPQAGASQIAAELGARGPILTLSSDCPAGLDAVGVAAHEIAAGHLEAALAGGVDAPVTPLLMIAFNRTGALSEGNADPARACRPFDRARDGFVMAEGGAFFVLETLEGAHARGARLHGEVLGIGWGTDPSSEFGRAVGSDGFEAAMRVALRAAGLAPGGVDLICAHAPGIPATDLAEACAIARLHESAATQPLVTSIKGAVGQALAGGAALQVAVALAALAEGAAPPTVNCEDPDPGCPVAVVRGKAVRRALHTALVNSHGFGGNNTALLVGAPPA